AAADRAEPLRQLAHDEAVRTRADPLAEHEAERLDRGFGGGLVHGVHRAPSWGAALAELEPARKPVSQSTTTRGSRSTQTIPSTRPIDSTTSSATIRSSTVGERPFETSPSPTTSSSTSPIGRPEQAQTTIRWAGSESERAMPKSARRLKTGIASPSSP